MSVPSPAWPVLLALGAALLSVAVVDLRRRRIPNELAMAIAATGLVHAGLVGGGWGVLGAAGGLAVGLAGLYYQWTRAWVGGGDVKLMAAVGAWVGVWGALEVILIATVLGGVLAILALIWASRRQRREVGYNLFQALVSGEIPTITQSAVPAARSVPFGVSIAATAAGYLLFTSGVL